MAERRNVTRKCVVGRNDDSVAAVEAAEEFVASFKTGCAELLLLEETGRTQPLSVYAEVDATGEARPAKSARRTGARYCDMAVGGREEDGDEP